MPMPWLEGYSLAGAHGPRVGSTGQSSPIDPTAPLDEQRNSDSNLGSFVHRQGLPLGRGTERRSIDGPGPLRGRSTSQQFVFPIFTKDAP
jgi:hypothetical protein